MIVTSYANSVFKIQDSESGMTGISGIGHKLTNRDVGQWVVRSFPALCATSYGTDYDWSFMAPIGCQSASHFWGKYQVQEITDTQFMLLEELMAGESSFQSQKLVAITRNGNPQWDDSHWIRVEDLTDFLGKNPLERLREGMIDPFNNEIPQEVSPQ